MGIKMEEIKMYEEKIKGLVIEEINIYNEELNTEGNLESREYKGKTIRVSCEKCGTLLEVYEPDVALDRLITYWSCGGCKHFRLSDWDDRLDLDEEGLKEFERERARALYETRADGKYIYILPHTRSKKRNK